MVRITKPCACIRSAAGAHPYRVEPVGLVVVWIKRIAKWLGIGLAALLLAAAAYQQIGLAIDAATAPPRGQTVEVEGHKATVVCSGTGQATFVLDAGLGAWSFEWFRIQPILAKHARVCAIDRPGLGRSERWGDAYDAGAAADVMAKIVRAAGIARPFVYVGHSLGANFAEVYAAKYPHDVASLVLLEPGLPRDLLEDFHGTRAEAMALSSCDLTCKAGWVAGVLGVPRIMIPLINLGAHSFAGAPDALAEYRRGLSRTGTPAVTASYFAMLPKTAYQCAGIESFGDTPVLLIASSDPREPEGAETWHDVAVWTVGQRRYFAELAAKSTHGAGPVVIQHTNHGSMTTGPQAPATAAAILAFARDNGLMR